MLEHGITDGANGTHCETGGDAGDWTPVDALGPQVWVDKVVHEWCRDDDGDWVQVVQKIVWNTVGAEGGGEGIGGGSETLSVDGEDWEEEEDTAGLEGTADIVDKLIVVTVLLGRASSSADRWKTVVPETLAAEGLDTAVDQDLTEDTEGVSEVRSSWWLLDKTLVQPPEQRWKHQVDDGWEKVGGPETDQLGEVRGWDSEGSANVDEKVEPQHDTVERLLWIDNDFLAGLRVGDDVGDLVWGLIHDGGGNIWLKHGCSALAITRPLGLGDCDLPEPMQSK